MVGEGKKLLNQSLRHQSFAKSLKRHNWQNYTQSEPEMMRFVHDTIPRIKHASLAKASSDGKTAPQILGNFAGLIQPLGVAGLVRDF